MGRSLEVVVSDDLFLEERLEKNLELLNYSFWDFLFFKIWKDPWEWEWEWTTCSQVTCK